MSLKTYEIPYFIGLDQSGSENRLAASYSPDAVNMETEGGTLSVAKGYTKHDSATLPGTGRIDLLTSLRTDEGDMPVAITEGKVYALIDGSWRLKHTYAAPISANYDTAMVRIASTDYLVIADGMHNMLKFDGETAAPFGSEEGGSNVPCAYLTVYRGRLFAAGEAANPDRIYYSCLPGSGRTVEDWGYVEASPAVEGGHAEVGSVGGDPIVAIRALSNQLLIFKKYSLYRLIGDRPGNFTIEHIDANVPRTRHTAIAQHGDVLYFLTERGLYLYNGVTARPCPDMRLVKRLMANSNAAKSRAATVGDRLYFTLRSGEGDEVLIYDTAERKYMLRNGFKVSDLAVIDGKPMLLNDRRCLYIFEEGASYDGEPINAHWTTPLTDLSDKAAIKAPRVLFLRGTGGTVKVELELDGVLSAYRVRLPKDGNGVRELPLFGSGRTMRLRFSNEEGGSFALEAGAQLEFSARKRTE